MAAIESVGKSQISEYLKYTGGCARLLEEMHRVVLAVEQRDICVECANVKVARALRQAYLPISGLDLEGGLYLLHRTLCAKHEAEMREFDASLTKE